MLIFIKLGGSLITNKQKQQTYLDDVIKRTAFEILNLYNSPAPYQIIIGHGSGSFGHFSAARYGTANGVRSPEEWIGFTRVAHDAATLNHHVMTTLQQHGIPAMRFQPSASTICDNGVIKELNIKPIRELLVHNLVPVIHGDVAFDRIRGGTIVSTETLFAYLALHLPVKHIVLLGNVQGVFDKNRNIIPEITPTNLDKLKSYLRSSDGVDVTGGMFTKVTEMVRLAQQIEGLKITIADGNQPNILRKILIDSQPVGTTIYA
jgi:isopentenyl phosphate kinase